MARKPLKGMKKAKLSATRKEWKQKDSEFAKKKQKQRKNAQSNPGTKKAQEYADALKTLPNKKLKLEKRGLSVVDGSASNVGVSKKTHEKNCEVLRGFYRRAHEKILLVGEGNFSFARALCESLGCGENLVATAYDDKATLSDKYPDAKANVKFLKESGPEVCVGVDCRQLSTIRNGAWDGEFDRIVFQFPHLGTGETDVGKNVAEHRKLLSDFFREAEKCLNMRNTNAQVHVTLKLGEPYASWKVGPSCTEATEGRMQLKTAHLFHPEAFPGYSHRRTIGFKSELSAEANEEILKAGAKTYVFGWNKKLLKEERAE